MDRPLANECNNYSSPRYLSTWANRGPGPTSSSGVEKEEDPGFPGNHILACVDSYSERLFTMYSIYIHIYIQKVFLLQCFPFYKAVLWYSYSTLPPQQSGRALSRCHMNSVTWVHCMVWNQRMNEAFRNLIFKKRDALYFIFYYSSWCL